MARAWHLTQRPQGLPTLNDMALRALPTRALEPGEVRVANRFLSVDPYMRGRMNDGKSYVAPFALDRPMEGGAVGEVVESRADALPVGAMVQHMAGWRDEAVMPAAHAIRLPALDVSPSDFLGVLGITGLTAWFGLLDVARAEAGQTLFVSAAAGAVGSVVVQLAKARGLRVIGSAGGVEKAAWVRELGADAAIDYKAEGDRLVRALREAAPEGIHVYFDNVGGPHLDAALACANNDARFAICGLIHGYNSAEPLALRYAARIIQARLSLRGFIVGDFAARFGEAQADLAALLRDGTMTRRETVSDGLDAMPAAFLGLFSGTNLGKAIVRV